MHASNANNCLNSDTWLEKGSQREYGSHKAQFTNNLREKKCIYCNQRKPASLEELSFSVILEKAELLKRVDSAFCHLPHRICWLIGRALNANLLSQAWKLVDFVSEYGETRPSWFDVDQSKTTVLSRFRLYCEVNQKLKPYKRSESAGIDEILRYLSNVDSTYEDFWSGMTSAMTQLKAEIDRKDFVPPRSRICADDDRIVLLKATELTSDSRLGLCEYESLKELQILNKTFACPVIFKPTTFGLVNLESHKIPNMLDNIDPEVIVDVDIRKIAWSDDDIDVLGRVLSACNNLSSIYLRQKPTTDEVREGFAPAVSRLLSHHHQLQKIGLTGFNLAGTFARYPLPPVRNLQLRLCTFLEEDLSFMANRSNLALKTLVVSSYFYDEHFPSLSIFIQNQAKSLTTLGLEYPTLALADICELLRIMAKFSKLRVFMLNCVEELGLSSIEKIIVDLMSIHSTRQFFIDIPTTSNGRGFDAETNLLNDVVKELCKVNRRPPIEIGLNKGKSA